MGSSGIQFLTAFIISALLFEAAVTTVWPSYGLRMLESTNSPLGFAITKYDSNFIASISMLGSLSAMFVTDYLNDKIGRKRTEILSALFFVLGWSILVTAKTVTTTVIGRFVLGFASGIQMITNLVFISEMAHMTLQGPLLAILSFAFNIGSVSSYVEGWFCSYQLVCYINLTISVGIVILLSLLKETPPYLVKIGKEKEALHSLMFYRGAKTITQDILDEITYIRKQQASTSHYNSELSDSKLDYEKVKINENSSEDENVNNQNLKQSPWQILLSSKSAQRALILVTAQTMMSVFMGMIGIQTYAGQLFSQVAPDLSPDLCSIILAVVITFASAVAIFTTDLIPRRVLMLSTSTCAAICMALLASMLHWSWVPEWCIPLTIVIFSISFQVGPGNITLLQLGECIPPQLKSLGSPIVMCSLLIANFILLYLFTPTVTLLGIDSVFFLFSCIGILTIVFVYFFMRETRKEPSENVQRMYEEGFLYRRN